jgi:hypothetical protein
MNNVSTQVPVILLSVLSEERVSQRFRPFLQYSMDTVSIILLHEFKETNRDVILALRRLVPRSTVGCWVYRSTVGLRVPVAVGELLEIQKMNKQESCFRLLTNIGSLDTTVTVAITVTVSLDLLTRERGTK